MAFIIRALPDQVYITSPYLKQIILVSKYNLTSYKLRPFDKYNIGFDILLLIKMRIQYGMQQS